MTEIYNKNAIKEIRKTLRKRATETEKILWRHLKQKKFCGIRFKRQYSVGSYVLDFYCPKFRLAIEIDGGYHLKKDVQQYDKIRQENIENVGIKFVRFSNEETLNNIENVLQKIEENLNSSPLLE